MTAADIIVVGAGPAGLMAAEVAAKSGLRVVVVDAMATPGRKFLMAGKSGLNLTKDESVDTLLARYDSDWLAPILRAFDNHAVMDWARGLGVTLFTGSTGRVFPDEMKASRLLRAWLARLDGLGVRLLTRHHLRDIGSGFVDLDTGAGPLHLTAPAIILALGGASWPALGSTAGWVPMLEAKGVEIAPFAASNAGLVVAFSAHMQRFFGQPVKTIRATSGAQTSAGELVITSQGIEGGAIYELSAPLRAGAGLTIDLVPQLDPVEIRGRLARTQAKDSLSNRLRKGLNLSPVKLALFHEFGGGDLASLKALTIPHQGLAPLTRAISSAGGIRRDAVDADLMLRALPGVYAAGEMLDWDAPTGGYLLTACLATGHWAGSSAARVASTTVH